MKEKAHFFQFQNWKNSIDVTFITEGIFILISVFILQVSKISLLNFIVLLQLYKWDCSRRDESRPRFKRTQYVPIAYISLHDNIVAEQANAANSDKPSYIPLIQSTSKSLRIFKNIAATSDLIDMIVKFVDFLPKTLLVIHVMMSYFAKIIFMLVFTKIRVTHVIPLSL